MTSSIIETGIWSKSPPQIPFGSFNTSALFRWRCAPHWSLQRTHNARTNSTKSWYSLICSWFGPCLDTIGEVRCTAAAMQVYPLHRRSVSSIIRAARLGNFNGKNRGGKLSWNSLSFTVFSLCIQTRKVFQGGGLFYSRRRRRNRLETCLKKQRNVDKKILCFTAVELEKKRDDIVRVFFC